MTQRRFQRAGALFVVVGLLVASCSDGDDATPTTTTAISGGGGGGGGGTADDEAAPRTFGVRLSEGSALAAAPQPVEVVTGSELDAGRVDEILARLPEWAGGEAEQTPFNWPVQSVPPPRTGATVDVPFPATGGGTTPDVPSGPLHVLRYQPEGDVPVAPYVAVTFDQPMVPVGTLAQVEAADVPVTITPALDGTWTWVGTRTLRFDHVAGEIDRLPMATTYTVTVPAGTTSVTGGELAEEVRWTFTTPPPTAQSLGPVHEAMARDQLWTAVFDQRIDPAAVLATIRVTADGEQVPLRLATAHEVAADDSARNTSEQAADGRWMAFRPVAEMPADAAVSIELGPGTPSAEGPAVTTGAQSYSGRTYAPLQVVRVLCEWSSDQPCTPGGGFVVEFNNPLDGARTDAAAVTVAPALPGHRAYVQYSAIVVNGGSVPRTEYTITVPAGVTDVYGQTLGEAVTRTVQVGEAPPSIEPYDAVTTLDPFGEGRQLTTLTVNQDELRVRVFAVTIDDFADYYEYTWERDGATAGPPGWDVLSDTTLRPEGGPDVPVLSTIDLADELGDAAGHVVVLVEPVPAVPPGSDDYWNNRPALTWVQSTSIAVDAFTDAGTAVVWATDLRTGAPVEGVEVTITGGSDRTVTDADGVGRLDLPASDPGVGRLLVATKGADTAILPAWMMAQSQRDTLRWYVFDDRQMYRPGETMRVKGWVRRLSVSGDATLALPADGTTVRWTATDAYGVELAVGTSAVGALGGFDLEVELPETANLGQATLILDLQGEPGVVDGNGIWHSFQVQQYRRPEFEVTARPESEGPYVSTSPATVAAEAAYYAGGPLPDAEVDWRVATSEGTYSPPGWSHFTFGVWQPWWWYDAGGAVDGGADGGRPLSEPCCGPVNETTVEEYRGTTDANGAHYLQLEFEGEDGVLPDLPVVVQAEATVTDVNRQAWAARTDLLVHAATRYVGLRTTRTFVRQGEPLDVEVIVTDIDGAAVAGVALTVTAGRVEWVYENGQWSEQVLERTECTVTSAADPVECSFPTELGGQYRITSVVADGDGGRNRTELTTWVSGAASRPSTRVEQEVATVVPDKAEYAPGDTAELLVQAPFTTGEGLLAVARNGIRSTERFTIADGTAVLSLPITEADVPGLQLTVEVVGSTARTAADGSVLTDLPPRPAYAVGGLTIPVSLASRTLTVEATPVTATVLPGADTSIAVEVTDATGRPVAGAELAVVVVDEAVLALSAYELTDPLAAFYAPFSNWTGAHYSRSLLRLLDPEVFGGNRSGSGDDTSSTTMPAQDEDSADGGGAAPEEAPGVVPDGEGGDGTPIIVRSEFDALALFEPSVVTAADGTASVDVTMPDTLTRYRVMVVAVAGDDRFGTGESNVTAQLPLSVRPSAPRFANFGDTFELPVVVQNLGATSLDAAVVLETSNLTPGEPAGRLISVPAGDRVEVRFPVSTEQAGTAAYRVAVVSGDLADAAVGSLPVYTPATAEAFATYGVVDDGAVLQPLLAPEGVIPQFGGLEVTTSSTSLQALTDAVLYITRYPYDSTDAMASRIMSVAALRDVLDAFEAEGLPSAAELHRAMTADVEGLVARQMWDGGWGWWDMHHESLPFHTVQVTHALLLAREEGYTVPQATLDNALTYLADIQAHIPSEYGQNERDTIRAYALWVRALAGQRDAAAAGALFDERGSALQPDALAWIWGSLDGADHTEVGRLLANRVVETAGAANISTSYTDDAYVILHSDRRTDGIVLDAMVAEDPDSDLIPKLVNGLLAHRVQGRWDDIQENSFILLALHRYFTVYEAQTPEFVARVWLGERFAGDHTFSGRETDRARVELPMGELLAAGDTDLVLAKDGTGRLYYRIGLRYAPSDLTLDAEDRGFSVLRTYEAVDDPDDVWQDAGGTWHVKAGARVRVRLTMVAESQRTHVALVDPLPAGLEALNPVLAVTQTVPGDEGGEGGPVPLPVEDMSWWWWGPWYEHQQLRDDRSEAFTTFLPAGVYEYSYVARATTPGTFVVPPTRAEEMYAPETFGRTASDRLIVEAPGR